MLHEDQKLVKQLQSFTISSFEDDEVYKAKNKKNLVDFPTEILTNIFGYIGSRSFNSDPSHQFTSEYEMRARLNDAYAIKNLLSLRRVCKKFEEIINNVMTPGLDYDSLIVDVEIKGSDSRAVTLYKNGGTGILYPVTHLSRIRRLNEFGYDHIKNFEKIRELYLVDLVLNLELFETIQKMDLSEAKSIKFVRIRDVNFGESIDPVYYIQHFLNTIDSPAAVTFNSDVFDPNVVLFGSVPEVHMEKHSFLRSNFPYSPGERLNAKMKNNKRKRQGYSTAGCRKNKGIQLIKNVSRVLLSDDIEIGTNPGIFTVQKSHHEKWNAHLEKIMSGQRIELKKAGRWHLKCIFDICHTKKSTKSLIFHLKMLMKISRQDPIDYEKEISIIQHANEMNKREQIIQQFPFLSKFNLKSRCNF